LQQSRTIGSFAIRCPLLSHVPAIPRQPTGIENGMKLPVPKCNHLRSQLLFAARAVNLTRVFPLQDEIRVDSRRIRSRRSFCPCCPGQCQRHADCDDPRAFHLIRHALLLKPCHFTAGSAPADVTTAVSTNPHLSATASHSRQHCATKLQM